MTALNIVRRAVRKADRSVKHAVRLRKARRTGLVYQPPNYIYFPRFTHNSVVIDAGCGHVADFSLLLIEQYGVKAFGVDPTRKHQPALRAVEEQHPGRFMHLPLAITANGENVVFHESASNESGSILENHNNMMNDETTRYEVESVDLRSLLHRVQTNRIDIIKLDLEGAEYDLLSKAKQRDLLAFDQIFVEFHHHAIADIEPKDTLFIVSKMREQGFVSYSLDDRNYLFVQQAWSH